MRRSFFPPLGTVFLAALLCLLVFPAAGFATQIDVNDVRISLAKSGEAQIRAEVDYKFLSTEKAFYLVFARVSNVRATDNLGPLDCVLEKQSFGTQIACVPNVVNRTNYTMRLTFDAADLVEKADSVSRFRYSYTITNPTSLLKVSLRLPEGDGLVKENAFSPSNATIGSTGRQVTLDWVISSPDLGKTYAFEARSEPLFGIPFTYDYLYGVAAAVAILILYFWRRTRKTSARTILSVLSSKEKAVLDVLISKGGAAKQRDIVRATTFSKAKVSRIVASLVERGLLKKQAQGRTNKVTLADKRLKEASKEGGRGEKASATTEAEEPREPKEGASE